MDSVDGGFDPKMTTKMVLQDDIGALIRRWLRVLSIRVDHHDFVNCNAGLW